ncbi:phage holin family protein [Luteimonas sp. MC1572]|uniref:phage holin family protein n=1 Tax=Luteimonas sp. MC1572 TaxID=2799325 RepID=UPI0018F103C3|nr:phage holin family protein [Luteimonas sp. MC1572]MBJ6981583.1 phage holin family protein [Luteimonas sp. MC1572]QQO02881.1 phage holin family protein [Luteimonas sp. MC1572]
MPGEGAPDRATDGAPPPDLIESLRGLRDTGKSGVGAAGEAAKAFRSLVVADVSLARSAAGRSIAFAGVAVVFGASSWLLLMAALIVLLSSQLGLPWWVALCGCAMLSALGAWLAVRKAAAYFEHTRLKTTRRQLARLGIGELSELVPGAASAESARAAEVRVREEANRAPVRDERGVNVTPP